MAKLGLETENLPTFSSTPASQIVAVGTVATFRVTLNDTTATTFQWFHNDQIIEGAVADTYAVGSATAADEGVYYVEVTNPAGRVRSPAAQLTIHACETILPCREGRLERQGEQRPRNQGQATPIPSALGAPRNTARIRTRDRPHSLIPWI